jgi:hypothetical protein
MAVITFSERARLGRFTESKNGCNYFGHLNDPAEYLLSQSHFPIF